MRQWKKQQIRLITLSLKGLKGKQTLKVSEAFSLQTGSRKLVFQIKFTIREVRERFRNFIMNPGRESSIFKTLKACTESEFITV